MNARQNNVELHQPNVTMAEIWDPTTAGEDVEVIHQELTGRPPAAGALSE
jgi:hypothetical protein